jgi:hypothetical protein
METDSFITINGVCINENTDINTKDQLLKKNGANVTRNSDGSVMITGAFSITRQKSDNGLFDITNAADMHIKSGTIAILYGFNNLATASLRLDSGSLENTFIKLEPKEYTTSKLLLTGL